MTRPVLNPRRIIAVVNYFGSEQEIAVTALPAPDALPLAKPLFWACSVSAALIVAIALWVAA